MLIEEFLKKISNICCDTLLCYVQCNILMHLSLHKCYLIISGKRQTIFVQNCYI